MASIGFLLAPVHEIPEQTDLAWRGRIRMWIYRTDAEWEARWDKLPEKEQERYPMRLGGANLASHGMDGTCEDEALRKGAKAWTAARWKEWTAAGRPLPLPDNGVTVAHAVLGMTSKVAIPDLLNCDIDEKGRVVDRYGWTVIPARKLARGGAHGFVHSGGRESVAGRSALYFNGQDAHSRNALLEIARAHGGDHLALWTYGNTVQLLLARSPAPGQLPRVERMGLRLRRTGKRTELATLRAWFEGAALRPDWERVERELAAETISIPSWFEAFGIPGAREAVPPDAPAIWAALEAVAAALLRGETVDKKALARVNEILETVGGAAKLPARAGKLGQGKMARLVADAASSLVEAVGPPAAGAWAERRRAAATYWDITDGAAVRRFTFPAGRKGLGEAGSLARLLAHYPAALARDEIFLALAGLQCEAANGHSFVEPLAKLAEGAARAGLVAIVVPAVRREKLRQAMELVAHDDADDAKPGGPWAGEAFVDLPTLGKTSAAEALRAFVTREKTDAVMAVLSPGGAVDVVAWQGGGVGDAKKLGLRIDAKDLASAGRALDPRAIFPALGAGDLLAPGAWTEGSYGGGGARVGAEARDYSVERRLLAKPPEPRTIDGWRVLEQSFARRIAYRGPLEEEKGGIVALRVRVPGADDQTLKALRADMKLIDCWSWIEGGEVWGGCRGWIAAPQLADVLADLPSGTRLSLAQGPKEIGSWVRRPAPG